MWKCFEKFVLNFAKFYVKLSWKLSPRLKATSLTDRVSHLNHVNHLKRPRHVRCFLQKYFVYYHVWVSFQWNGQVKMPLKIICAQSSRLFSQRICGLETPTTRGSGIEVPFQYSVIILCFHFIWQFHSICLNVMSFQLRFGWVRVGSVGSRNRFSHSYCLFWLLCLKSILPKCG